MRELCTCNPALSCQRSINLKYVRMQLEATWNTLPADATFAAFLLDDSENTMGVSVAKWLSCWTQAQKGPGSNRSRDAVG